LPQLCNRP